MSKDPIFYYFRTQIEGNFPEKHVLKKKSMVIKFHLEYTVDKDAAREMTTE